MNKREPAIVWYLAIIYIFTFGLGVLECCFPSGIFYSILQTCFTPLPVIAAWIVRRVSGKKEGFGLSLKVWKNWKMWLFSTLAPAIAIAMGAWLYFSVFPKEYSGVFQLGLFIGDDSYLTISNPLSFTAVCILISAVCIPIQLLELGEEIGWREYLLWHQVQQHGAKKAVLINGFQWGLAHLPLIWLGFNYSPDNPCAPWSNMALMILTCMVMGILFSYVTLKTGNCMYAAVMHGVSNVIGEFPVFCSASLKSGLLGPNPTGLLSMVFLIVLAVILFPRLDQVAE